MKAIKPQTANRYLMAALFGALAFSVSTPKIRTVSGVAEATQTGTVDLASSSINCPEFEQKLDKDGNVRCVFSNSTTHYRGNDIKTSGEIYVDKKNNTATILTEAECDKCDADVTITTPISLGQYKNSTEIYAAIKAQYPKLMEKSMKQLREKVKRQHDEDNCLANYDDDGKRHSLSTLEAAQCHMAKLEDTDSDKRDAYFEKHLKSKLEALLNSSNSSDREKGQEMVAQLMQSGLNQNSLTDLKMLVAKATFKVKFAQMQAQLQAQALRVQLLPANSPQKQMAEARLKAMSQTLQLQSGQASQQLLAMAGNNIGALQDVSNFSNTLNQNMQTLYQGTPALAAMQAQSSSNSTAVQPVQLQLDGRLSRAGTLQSNQLINSNAAFQKIQTPAATTWQNVAIPTGATALPTRTRSSVGGITNGRGVSTGAPAMIPMSGAPVRP